MTETNTIGIISLVKLIRSTIHWWDDIHQCYLHLSLLHCKNLAEHYRRAPDDLKAVVMHDLMSAICNTDSAVHVEAAAATDGTVFVEAWDHENHRYIGGG